MIPLKKVQQVDPFGPNETILFYKIVSHGTKVGIKY